MLDFIKFQNFNYIDLDVL